jgi:hypothetical protein
LVNYLRNHCTVFHGSRTIFHSYPQCRRAPVSPHPVFVFIFTIKKVYHYNFYMHFSNDW